MVLTLSVPCQRDVGALALLVALDLANLCGRVQPTDSTDTLRERY